MENKELELLIEIVKQNLFEKEPLAVALLTYLSQEGVLHSEDVIAIFNKTLDKKIKDSINEIYDEEKGQETVF